jgi:hypothetical protein
MKTECAALQSQILLNLIAWPISEAAQDATVIFTGFIGLFTMHTLVKLRSSLNWTG